MARNGVGVGVGLFAALVMPLAACSWDYGKAPAVNPNIYPAQYKQEILATLRTLLGDPTHISGGLISDPALTPVNKEQRYTACVRFSEQDSTTKQYDPPQTRVAYFYGGHLNQLVKAEGDQCATAAYKPFPEVEKLCLAKQCQ